MSVGQRPTNIRESHKRSSGRHGEVTGSQACEGKTHATAANRKESRGSNPLRGTNLVSNPIRTLMRMCPSDVNRMELDNALEIT